jgi:hypothetical protein
MNFFAPHVNVLLMRAPWQIVFSTESKEFFMKYICHVADGLSVVLTDLSCSSWVGALATDQMLRSVTLSAPGIQLEPTELLRVVDEAFRHGIIQFSVPEATRNVSIVANFSVDIIAGHQLRAGVKIDVIDVVNLSDRSGMMAAHPSADFVKEVVIRPLMQWQSSLEQVLQLLVDQRRVTPDELISVARIAVPSATASSNSVWLHELRQRCFPDGEPKSHVAPSGGASPPLASRGDSTYVESPEELQRKRQREEERRMGPSASGSTQSSIKKIRKALR